jgi:peptide/nickel transport system substrate-binding protein
MDFEGPEPEVELPDFADSLDRRNFLGLVGAGAALAALAPSAALAQASGGGVTWAKPPVRFVYVNSADPNSLDPAITTLFNSYDVIRNVYDPLVWVDEARGRLVPWLAKSFETADNGRSHVFHLREGVRFHDGSLLDARTVQLNMQRYIALADVGNGYLISNIGRVTVLGRMTVKITTQKPDAWLPAHLTKFPIVSAKAIMDNRSAGDPWAKTFFNKNMVGSGGYMFGGWQPGVQITLNKNRRWWRGAWPAGSIDQVIVKPVVEASTRVELIQSGQADLCTQWTISDALNVGGRSGFTLKRFKTTTTSPIVFMNTKKPPLDNRLVRQAFVSAFDYDAMAKYYRGLSSPTGGPFPPFYPAADKSLTMFKKDMNRARSLLSQARVDPRSIKIKYMAAAEYPDLVAAGAITQASLQALGVDVDLQRIPYSQILAAYTNDANAGAMTAINNSPYTLDPTIFLAVFKPDHARANFYNLRMPEVISLIDRIAGETNDKRRQALLVQVQRAIRNQAPAIFGATPQTLIPLRNYIHGYVMQHTDFRYPTLFYTLRIAQH